MKIRNPVVAGRFYPDEREVLRRWIDSHRSQVVYSEAVGGISPHAGYVFSGDLACEVISSIEKADTVVILGPNHTGIGPVFSVSAADAWLTPLGEVKVDKEIRELVLGIDGMELDDTAHMYEHSIEVQLPIIQSFFPEAKIVPITVMGGLPLESYISVGRNFTSIHRSVTKRLVWIVSSDMNHYEDYETTMTKDRLAISAIETLDPIKLWDVVKENDISMCGIYPSMMILAFLQSMECADVKTIRHKTSAETSGDYSQVVGYFGCVFTG